MFPDGTTGGALLVGSLPLRSSEEVFRTVAGSIGDRLRRMPDGETGPRSDWIVWQYPVLSSRPEFEVCPPGENPYRSLPRLRIRDGADVESLHFEGLGYADAARSSYRTFSLLKRDGVVPAHCRFQVCLPTPLAPISAFVTAEDQAMIEPIYERRMLDELEAILDDIPHDQLAVQWDTNFEFVILEGYLPTWFSDVRAGVVERLLRLARAVPADVQLGFHFCHSHEGRHQYRPHDAAKLVEVANALTTGLGRTVDWLHLPVAHDIDVSFFETLGQLASAPRPSSTSGSSTSTTASSAPRPASPPPSGTCSTSSASPPSAAGAATAPPTCPRSSRSTASSPRRSWRSAPRPRSHGPRAS